MARLFADFDALLNMTSARSGPRALRLIRKRLKLELIDPQNKHSVADKKEKRIKQAPAGAKRTKRKGQPRVASSYRGNRRNVLRAGGAFSAPARLASGQPYKPRSQYPGAVNPGSVRRAMARAELLQAAQ
jgi:hypothetical protein